MAKRNSAQVQAMAAWLQQQRNFALQVPTAAQTALYTKCKQQHTTASLVWYNTALLGTVQGYYVLYSSAPHQQQSYIAVRIYKAALHTVPLQASTFAALQAAIAYNIAANAAMRSTNQAAWLQAYYAYCKVQHQAFVKRQAAPYQAAVAAQTAAAQYKAAIQYAAATQANSAVQQYLQAPAAPTAPLPAAK